MSPAAGGMIAKTFFLAKIIHRIGTQSLRGKKGLHENLAGYRIFFALRTARRAVRHREFVVQPDESLLKVACPAG
jgi:hypothetical protein